MRHDAQVPPVSARRSRALRAVVVIGVLAAVLVYAVADNLAVTTTCYLGVIVAASIGAWVGAERSPHGRRLVPRLIALGISLSVMGDVAWDVLDLTGAETDVSIADAPWFASYVVLCAALWIVVRRSRGREDRRIDIDYAIDAVTIVVVSVLVFYSLSVETIVADGSESPLVRTVWAAYPVGDAILLALMVRVLLSENARSAIGLSFGVGVCLWLVADLIYVHAAGSALAMSMADAAWMVTPVLLARAAWRVSKTETVAPGTVERWSSLTLIVVAVGPLLVPPALELLDDLRGEPNQPLELFLGTAVLIVLAFVRTARLIHTERDMRRELEVTRDAALEASRAKSTFLANVSHEIRTPLTTVLASAELLEDTPLDDQQRSLLERTQRSAERLKKLVEGILDFSHIESGRLGLTLTEFDLHELVADVAETYASLATQAGIRFHCDADPRLPQRVVGDPARVFQVLANLLDNALKFTPAGRIELVVRPTTPDGSAGARESVEFVVSDTGIGIHQADQASVFESFSQVDGSTTRRYGGSGVGLAICRQLTELMGGSITLQSEFGVGSTFVVRVPIVRPTKVLAAPEPALPLAG